MLDIAFYGALLVLVGGVMWLGNHLGKQPLTGPMTRDDRDEGVGGTGIPAAAATVAVRATAAAVAATRRFAGRTRDRVGR